MTVKLDLYMYEYIYVNIYEYKRKIDIYKRKIYVCIYIVYIHTPEYIFPITHIHINTSIDCVIFSSQNISFDGAREYNVRSE
jgi:hypothetical protein